MDYEKRKILNNSEIQSSNNTDNFIAYLEDNLSSILPFACREYIQSFNAECDLKLHESTHSKIGEFICSDCKKQFASKFIFYLTFLYHNGCLIEKLVRRIVTMIDAFVYYMYADLFQYKYRGH